MPLRALRQPIDSSEAKAEIVANSLPRYTGTPAKEFSKYILLGNFTQYVHLFAEWHGIEVRGSIARWRTPPPTASPS